MALSTNLISYWKLDESSGNAADSAGSNTLTNSNVTYTAAKINNGAVFNGTSSQFTKASLASVTSVSISFWVNFNTFGSQIGLIDKTTGGNGWRVWAGTTWSGLLVTFNSTNITVGYTFSTGTWYHVAVTFTGGAASTYVNGVLIDRTTSVTLTDASATLYVGSGVGTVWFDGKMDEIGYWDKALSSLEVAELYNNSAALAYPLTDLTVTLPLNLASYFKLDESSGDASDSVGSNTLTNSGSASYSAGKINNGVDFSATTKYLGRANPTGLATGHRPFSIAAWVKFTNFSSARYFIGFGENANNKIVAIRCDNATTWLIDDNGVGTAFPAVSSMSTGTWYHIVYTYPGYGNVYTAYLNGSSIGTADNTRAPNLGTTVMGLGSRGNTSVAENLVGSLDEVGFWNRELTSGEVTTLYNGGSGKAYPLGNYTATLTETVTNTATLIKTCMKFLTETVTHTASMLRNATRIFTETVTHTATFLGLKIISGVCSDTVNYTDSILRQISRNLIDTITHTDTFSKIQTLVRSFTDTITHTDVFISVRTLVRVFTETTSLVDQVIVRLNGIVTNFWSKVARGSDSDSDWTRTPFN